MFGDFNHPGINWHDTTSTRDRDNPSTCFIVAVHDLFLIQHVTEPTHYRGNCTPNTLDLIFTNEEGMLENVKHRAPVGKSHHTLLHFTFCCYIRITDNKANSYRYHKGDYDSMRTDMEGTDWEEEFHDRGVELCWS